MIRNRTRAKQNADVQVVFAIRNVWLLKSQHYSVTQSSFNVFR